MQATQVTSNPEPATAAGSASFEIYDRVTGAIVGKATTRPGARRSVDRRDNAFGAYRYAYRVAGSSRASL